MMFVMYSTTSWVNHVNHLTRVGGLDSLYHVQTNVSVGWGIIWGISVHTTYIKKRYCFSSVCTLKKAINKFELNLDVQKGPLKSRGKVAIHVIVSSNLLYSSKWHMLQGQIIKHYILRVKICFNDFSHWKVKMDYICNEGPFLSWCIFVYIGY